MKTCPAHGPVPSILTLLLILFLTGCNPAASTWPESGRNLDFNQGWSFFEGQEEGAGQSDFDDSQWRLVDLPHDWSMEDYSTQDSLHSGPYFKDLAGGPDVGYLRGGTGWYRKSFTLDRKHEGKNVILHFDGIQSEMEIWVNGEEAGRHVYGYTPFYFDITPYLQPPGTPNQIAIKVVNPGENSRWFNGAGIYRPVTISLLDPVHVEVWGLAITTSYANGSEATVSLDLNVCNKLDKGADVSVLVEIISPDGATLAALEKKEGMDPGSTSSIEMDLPIDQPELWSPEYPALYLARITLSQNGKKVDEYSSSFGIRTIAYSADQGFLLNGSEILLKGACMHHDNGLLGAAVYQRAEERRVQIMKENGFNAIRTSHNPPSAAFLEACDRLGMLVIDESFDMWVQPKRPNDYHLHYNEWWQRDLQAMLLRDRNHPSIIMWSFGNEVQERANPEGVALANEMVKTIRSMDETRPITQAVCAFWDNPGKVWDDSEPAFSMLDIGGYNYQWQNYEKDHEKFPERIMAGTESVPKEAFENWQQVKAHPYVIGDFVWTGMDYIGESGIGHSDYVSDPGTRGAFLMPWPWYVSWCGDIDITGNKKPQSYYRDVIWGESRLEIMVHEPVPQGTEEVISFWGWPREVKSWNMEGHEGESLRVNVYSSFPEVRLELNGKVIGTRFVSEESKLTATFTVPYEPGKLTATGIRDGVEQEAVTLATTGPVTGLKLIPERSVIDADRNEIVYCRVLGTDSEDHVVPDAEIPFTINVTGEAELLAAGNGSPVMAGSLKDGALNLFRGMALVILRSTGRPGSISLEAASDDPEVRATATINAEN